MQSVWLCGSTIPNLCALCISYILKEASIAAVETWAWIQIPMWTLNWVFLGKLLLWQRTWLAGAQGFIPNSTTRFGHTHTHIPVIPALGRQTQDVHEFKDDLSKTLSTSPSKHNLHSKPKPNHYHHWTPPPKKPKYQTIWVPISSAAK